MVQTLDIAKQIYGVTSSYLNQMYGAGSEDFDMPSGGVYNNGSYVFLTGSFNIKCLHRITWNI